MGVPKRARVRCLGPTDREHWFWTTDPVRRRRCAACEKLVERLSKRAVEGLTVTKRDDGMVVDLGREY